MKALTSLSLLCLLALGAISLSSCSPGVGVAAGAPSTYSGRAQARPGLATGWGDEIRDRTVERAFARGSSQPYGVSTIRYNDREGIKDELGSQGWGSFGMDKGAKGLVEWGIKSGRSMLRSRHTHGFWSERLVRAREGKTYSIIIENVSKARIEIVASVDGLDVLDGKPASYAKRGYIIEPGKTLEIKGFRTATNAVAAFEFSSVGNSYANLRHGNTRNVGVIGIAAFVERGQDPFRSAETQRRREARPFAEAP